MKNILVVTGGAGFVGSNLIQLMLKKTRYKIISTILRTARKITLIILTNIF